MKCHNCGFESEYNFCPMCGTKTDNIPVSQSSPQPSVPFTQSIPNAQSTGINTQAPQNNPPVQKNPYIQNHQPIQQNIANNPFVQKPMNTPMANNMQPATPVPTQPQKPKSTKTGGVIAASILGAVILIGTILFSYSCISQGFRQEESNTNFEFERDFTTYTTSAKATAPYGSISLKSIETVNIVKPEDKTKEEFYGKTNGKDFSFQYKITFNIENTSEKAITVSADDFTVTYDSQNSDNSCPKVTKSETDIEQAVTLKSGEKKDFSIYHYAPTEAFQLNTEYRYTGENKKYLIKFCDYIEYQETEVSPGNITSHPMNLSFGTITLTDIVEADAKDESTKVYSLTLNVHNDTSNNIKVSPQDFAVYAYEDYFASLNKSNKHICTISDDEAVEIYANKSKKITVSVEIPKDYKTLFLYYKLHNHITNPDKPVSDKNYSIYGMIDPL